MIKKIILALAFFVFAGCGTSPLSEKQLLALSQTQTGRADNAIAEPVIQAAIDDANLVCSEVIGSRSTLAEKRSKKNLWISLGGLVAGAVVAPALISANAAANAPWIAAFSGMGGAANMATRTIDEAGFSGAADAQVMNSISASVKEKMIVAMIEPNGPKVRYEAAIAAKAECLYYPRYVYKLPSEPSPAPPVK
ncbi:hypothetical protein C1Y08_20805 [Pseudomonas sp. FW306-02-F02-AA]|uniref:Lipoprotein n=1 Tax=Pseudomonas fluorescens TaxID=294 RepID=A0A0N9WNZ0_PSEFL|nr:MULTISPECIES: hypothetical protein [Pseudomonas]ALI04425.1 hypothetical protein AO353_26435 [Pseudomonas fluorescens]PMZ03903.1 hypothetical protein C1Y07_11900 [Pseudomonas sp. FW306-02-F02-AB]PMZ08268.1 hypothetical protein C1Y06_20240 [Pseudomonas sp. FW306-02-H06C]PMZ14008.1 hypothetical protein C1Y08_20805 [Pseudomonas sp. FW306-02-F02-AA]PMZ21483.1 hypothetical protein C1Y09_13650 [Pseudomonas sp. FW306-02-F08-AA]